MSDSFKIKNRVNIAGTASASTVVGDLRVDSSDSNKLKFHDGSTEQEIIKADSVAFLGKADADLSNLANPTAVNQDLVFNTGADAAVKTANVIDTSASPKDVTLSAGDITDSSSTHIGAAATVSAGSTLGSGNGGDLTLYGGYSDNGGNGGEVLIFGGAANTGDTNGGNVFIESGHGSGSGKAGDIILTPAATTGKIKFENAGESASGQVWTSTDDTGYGAWATPSGGVSSSSVIFPDDNNYVPFALRRIGDIVFLNLELFAFTSMAGSGDADISANGIAGLVPSGFRPNSNSDAAQFPINYKQGGINKVGLVFIDGFGAGHNVYFYKDLNFGLFASGDTIESLTVLEGSWITQDPAP